MWKQALLGCTARRSAGLAALACRKLSTSPSLVTPAMMRRRLSTAPAVAVRAHKRQQQSFAAQSAVAACVLGATVVGTALLLPRHNAETKSARHQFIADAVEKVLPSVVYVSSSFHTFFGDMGQGGSGFVFSSDGFIATNSHVVALAASSKSKTVSVTLSNGTTLEGEVWAMDVSTDLALIKVDSPVPLQKADIGSSSLLRPGEWVVALGSPMNLQNTVTMGIVSSKARQAIDLGMSRSFDFIQTDCSINSGNSGGPLCDLDGAVVGINTMKAAGPEGISFAIPIDSAYPVLEQLREFKSVRRPYLGVRMIELEPRMILYAKRRSPDFPDVSEGVYISEVVPKSPAARAGLESGDIITAIDNVKIFTANDVLKALGFEVGKKRTLTVMRGKTTKTFDIITEQADGNKHH